jgi:hypothetical protein
VDRSRSLVGASVDKTHIVQFVGTHLYCTVCVYSESEEANREGRWREMKGDGGGEIKNVKYS